MHVTDTAEKIKKMEIRGAGRIARAAVTALREEAGMITTSDLSVFRNTLEKAADTLLLTRITAVSLPNAVHMVMAPLSGEFPSVGAAKEKFYEACDQFIRASEGAVEQIGNIGAHHIKDGDTVMTHCNSEAALACLFQAHRNGTSFEVFATEVRPRNQGLLTIKTLNDAGIQTSYIVDSAARYFMKDIDLVVVGADAVSVNGAVVNKIGTSQIALAAHESRTRVMVAAETYKFAPRTILGEYIEIEEREGEEVLPLAVSRTLPLVKVRNPAFDVTPAEYIDLIVTEEGAIPPQMAYIVIRDYLGWHIGEFGQSPGKRVG